MIKSETPCIVQKDKKWAKIVVNVSSNSLATINLFLDFFSLLVFLIFVFRIHLLCKKIFDECSRFGKILNSFLIVFTFCDKFLKTVKLTETATFAKILATLEKSKFGSISSSTNNKNIFS